MSEEHESATPEQNPDVSAALAEARLQLAAATHERNQLAKERDRISQERDQFARERDQLAHERDGLRTAGAEKAELLRRLDELSRARDALSAQIETLTAERDTHAADKARISGELSSAVGRIEAAETARAKASAALAAQAEHDPLLQLWDAVCQLTTKGVLWVRGRIPPQHPALPYFDKTIETTKTLGCFAVTQGWAFVKWATPQVVALAQKLVQEAEARLAKK